MGLNKPVDFELAKLLKEKGFDEKIKGAFVDTTPFSESKNDFVEYSVPQNHNEKEHRISAPTIAEVVCWIYEKHGIWTVVNLDIMGRWYYDTYTITDGFPDHNTHKKIERFNSPTEAYLQAIEHVLKNLV